MTKPALEIDDDYYWLRDDDRKDKEILAVIKEENMYVFGVL